jgi:hypothetical protein
VKHRQHQVSAAFGTHCLNNRPFSDTTRIDPGDASKVLAETIDGLYKTEVIRRLGPGRHIDDVEYATLEWVDWFNHRRLLEPIGNVPPAELEMAYYRRVEESAMVA